MSISVSFFPKQYFLPGLVASELVHIEVLELIR